MVALIQNAVSTRHTHRIAGDESIGWDTPAAAAAPVRTRRPKARPARRPRAARQWRPDFDNDDTTDPTRWAELKAILTRRAEGVVAHQLESFVP